MAAIVESADDSVVRLGPDGRIETWNRGAARLYGYVGDEAVGSSPFLGNRPQVQPRPGTGTRPSRSTRSGVGSP